jgi:hexosaminidase
VAKMTVASARATLAGPVARTVAGCLALLAGACQAPGAEAPPPPAPEAGRPGSGREGGVASGSDGAGATDGGTPSTPPSDGASPPDSGAGGPDGAAEDPGPPVPLDRIVPRPAAVTPGSGVFRLGAAAAIEVEPASAELLALGQHLADRLRPATGFALPVAGASGVPAPGSLHLTTTGADPALGEEGYELRITAAGVTLAAASPAGLFRGLQTVRQLLPAAIERPDVQPGPWTLAAGTVRDLPRFAWRGAMLDLARHFFGVDILKRFVDLLAYYKLNRLHLHLSDDQGWRIAIDSWPRLTEQGGSTQVGGGPGGFLTKAQYAEIVAYAQARYITVVPEIDVPGHTNAALASYAELNCSGVAPALYTGVDVGFSTLCTALPITTRFMTDVIGEIAAMTPGPYLHLGGDEAMSTQPAEYTTFISAMQKLVAAAGKRLIGWEEIAAIDDLDPGTLVQHWNAPVLASRARQQGAKLIMSPASRAYLDMKYDAATPVGGTWAGFIDERRAYEWDPATQIPGIGEADIVGVEGPLWSETIDTREEIELLAMPRLAGYAEIGWSPAAGRTWDEYRTRIGSHGPRLAAMGVNTYRSPAIPWR